MTLTCLYFHTLTLSMRFDPHPLPFPACIGVTLEEVPMERLTDRNVFCLLVVNESRSFEEESDWTQGCVVHDESSKYGPFLYI